MIRVYADRPASWDLPYTSVDVEATLRFLASGRDRHRTLLDRYLPEHGIVGDIGCGLGRVSLFYAATGRRTVGVDFTWNPLRAVHAFAPRQPLLRASALALPFRDGALAAYVGLGVLEYDERGPDTMLLEARRVLAPGGLLYVSVPHANLWRRATGRHLRLPRGDRFHLCMFTAAEIRRRLEAVRFQVLVVQPASVVWGIRDALGLRLPGRVEALLSPLAPMLGNSLVVVARNNA